MAEKTLYLELTNENTAPYVIFSGDPRRVEKIITQLDSYEKIAVNREFHTYTGLYHGVPVTVSSTGIGGPSAAIALEEFFETGIKVAVRLGTVMGLKDNLGKFLVPSAAVRKEKTSENYVELGYPAVADFTLLQLMNESIQKNGRIADNGIVYSTDGYYTEMKESRLSKKLGGDAVQRMQELVKYNISGMDMETATLLTLGNLMGIKACSVTLATVTNNLETKLAPSERIHEEEVLAKIVLDGIAAYHESQVD